MSFWNESDIDAMLSGVGSVPIVHGSESGPGILDTYDEEILRGLDASLIGRVVAVMVRSSAFPTLKKREAITIDGVAHTVYDRMAVDDGALSRVLCLKG